MKIKGNLIVTKNNQNDYSDITEVSGSIDVIENATLTAPIFYKSEKEVETLISSLVK
jgi:hypothetical protein